MNTNENEFSLQGLTIQAEVVPEPTTMALFGLCVLGAGAYAYRRRKQGQAAA